MIGTQHNQRFLFTAAQATVLIVCLQFLPFLSGEPTAVTHLLCAIAVVILSTLPRASIEPTLVPPGVPRLVSTHSTSTALRMLAGVALSAFNHFSSIRCVILPTLNCAASLTRRIEAISMDGGLAKLYIRFCLLTLTARLQPALNRQGQLDSVWYTFHGANSFKVSAHPQAVLSGAGALSCLNYTIVSA
jgi:hypothetical protein